METSVIELERVCFVVKDNALLVWPKRGGSQDAAISVPVSRLDSWLMRSIVREMQTL